jgi:hypothetical protein
VDKKVQSEYESRFQDPSSELQHIRELYKEQARRKRLELGVYLASSDDI